MSNKIIDNFKFTCKKPRNRRIYNFIMRLVAWQNICKENKKKNLN